MYNGNSIANRLYNGLEIFQTIYNGQIIWQKESDGYQNGIINGNFASDSNSDGFADGWKLFGSSLASKSVSNNEQIFTVGAASSGIVPVTPPTNAVGDIIYVSCDVYADSNQISLRLAQSGSTKATKTHSSTLGYEHLSIIYTALDTQISLSPIIRDDKASGWTTIKVKNVICVNLTVLGLVDKDLAWCDANIPQNIVW